MRKEAVWRPLLAGRRHGPTQGFNTRWKVERKMNPKTVFTEVMAAIWVLNNSLICVVMTNITCKRNCLHYQLFALLFRQNKWTVCQHLTSIDVLLRQRSAVTVTRTVIIHGSSTVKCIVCFCDSYTCYFVR